MRELLALASDARRLRRERVSSDVLARQATRRRASGRGRRRRRGESTTASRIWCAARAAAPLIVVLDGIEDPHNLGAILRTADAAGVDGVVVQAAGRRRWSGARPRRRRARWRTCKIAEVVNIARALEELKELGVWTVGLAARRRRRYDAMDFTVPTAIVLGAEGSGLRRLVREKCDFLAAIPMQGHVGSLNVSVAAGVVLFEAVRQRRRRSDRPRKTPESEPIGVK